MARFFRNILTLSIFVAQEKQTIFFQKFCKVKSNSAWIKPWPNLQSDFFHRIPTYAFKGFDKNVAGLLCAWSQTFKEYFSSSSSLAQPSYSELVLQLPNRRQSPPLLRHIEWTKEPLRALVFCTSSQKRVSCSLLACRPLYGSTLNLWPG